MRHSFSVVLGLILLWFGSVLYSESTALRSQQRQIEDLKSKLRSKPDTASLEVQDRCSKQAAIAYNQDQIDRRKYGSVGMTSYTNHYSSKYNRCFVEIDAIDSKPIIGTSKTIMDAFESKVYASYVWLNPQGKKFWEVSPTTCSVSSSSGEEKTCTSSDEFDKLIKEFLEN